MQMTIHILTPFARDKNLGKAYNDAIVLIPDSDWICLMDYDAMFLMPEQINRMYEYVEKFPNASMFVCYGSRVHDLSPQSFKDKKYESATGIAGHIVLAQQQFEKGVVASRVVRPVAGFLMLFSKATWFSFKFIEGIGCLKVDTTFSKQILYSGGQILLMESIYIWHTYRLATHKKDITHLI